MLGGWRLAANDSSQFVMVNSCDGLTKLTLFYNTLIDELTLTFTFKASSASEGCSSALQHMKSMIKFSMCLHIQ